MGLRDAWVKAKAESKKEFKTAVKAKQEDLAKKAKGGDKAAQDKYVKGALSQMGLTDEEDPEKFFKFKADLGPNLDKVEKLLGAFTQVMAERKKLTAARICMDFGMLKKAEGVYAGSPMEPWLRFFGEIDNTDSAKAYKEFVEGPPFNKFHALVEPLLATGGDPAKLKAANADKLFFDLKATAIKKVGPVIDKDLGGGNGRLAKALVPSPPGFEAAMDGAITALLSYEKSIKDSISKWSDPKPDFRKPLTDVLTDIRELLKKAL